MIGLGPRFLPFWSGLVMSINFLVFWAVPIAGMGQLWKIGFKHLLLPIYRLMDQNSALRWIAREYVYTKPEHSDFFAISILLVINSTVALAVVFNQQLRHGFLPWWMVAAYYASWVGVGGRIMGAAYALAHKEGHYQGLYKKWLRNLGVDHVFENILGVFFGNVPWNFTTSHIFVHHKVDGGVGDTFYEWDIDRTSLSDFMLYVHRIFLHMIGYSSYKLLVANNMHSKAELLLKGVVVYWVVAAFILLATRSFTFVFLIYLQPLLCMSYFLALLNIGFHGFIEFDENGRSIPCVNATCIIEGDDDYFGEDDHMAHHYNTSVYYKDLPALQESKREEFKRLHASVFRQLSIVELSIFILVKAWDKLADHFVDYSGKMTKAEIIELLKKRAQTLEMPYEQYEEFLANPSISGRNALEIKPIYLYRNGVKLEQTGSKKID